MFYQEFDYTIFNPFDENQELNEKKYKFIKNIISPWDMNQKNKLQEYFELLKKSNNYTGAVLTNLNILKEMANQNVIIQPFNLNHLGTNSYDITLGHKFYRLKKLVNEQTVLDLILWSLIFMCILILLLQILKHFTFLFDFWLDLSFLLLCLTVLFIAQVVVLGKKNIYYNIYSQKHVEDLWELGEAEDHCLDNNIKQKIIWIYPNEMILSHTNEAFGGKNYILPILSCRSNLARNGISICKCSFMGNINYTNFWTLEIINHTSFKIPLIVGSRVGQVTFFYTGQLLPNYEIQHKLTQSKEEKNQQQLMDDWKETDMLPKLYDSSEIMF